MSSYCTGTVGDHDNDHDFTPNYEVSDGHDSKRLSESGSDQESPIEEQIVDYTPLEQVQGSRGRNTVVLQKLIVACNLKDSEWQYRGVGFGVLCLHIPNINNVVELEFSYLQIHYQV